jgi:hypothetical protein
MRTIADDAHTRLEQLRARLVADAGRAHHMNAPVALVGRIDSALRLVSRACAVDAPADDASRGVLDDSVREGVLAEGQHALFDWHCWLRDFEQALSSVDRALDSINGDHRE